MRNLRRGVLGSLVVLLVVACSNGGGGDSSSGDGDMGDGDTGDGDMGDGDTGDGDMGDGDMGDGDMGDGDMGDGDMGDGDMGGMGGMTSSAIPGPEAVTVIVGDESLLVSWDEVDSASGYTLYWSDSPGVTMDSGTAIEVTSADAEVTGLVNGDIYYLIVTAHVDGDESEPSDEVSAVPSATRNLSVFDGGEFGLVVRTDGTLWAFGSNQRGQLGTGTVKQQNGTPEQVGTDRTWRAAAAGQTHSLALKDDGSVWAFGSNSYGELGDANGDPDDGADAPAPTQVTLSGAAAQLGAGEGFSLALLEDGTLWAWGSDDYGQRAAGNSDGLATDTPTQIGADSDWASFEVGYYHVLALKTDGTLWAWGTGDYQLGLGAVNEAYTPMQITTPSGDGWLSVSAGDEQSIGITSDGALYVWGRSDDGRLGAVTPDDPTTPIRVGTDNDWVKASTGYQQNLMIKADGTLWSYGVNNDGELGHGDREDRDAPVQVGSDTDWVDVQAAYSASFAVKRSGAIYSFGTNDEGVLGLGDDGLRLAPGQLGADSDWIDVSATLGALKSDGSFWAWGLNSNLQLGFGDNVNRQIPEEAFSPGGDHPVGGWDRVVSGGYRTFLFTAAGDLWGFGVPLQNGFRPLGFRCPSSTYCPPTQIGSATWLHVSAGTYHSMGIVSDASDEELHGVGSNFFGELGDGTTTARIGFSQIGTEVDYEDVSAGPYHTLVLRNGGQLYTMGRNNFGQLGLGTVDTNDHETPTQVPGTYSAVFAGDSRSFAITSTGDLLAWGADYGRLGVGTEENVGVPTPTPVCVTYETDTCTATLGNVESVTYGTASGAAIKADGTLWTFGNGGSGQLGLGVAGNSLVAVQVGSDTDWKKIVFGRFGGVVALKDDGTIWTWGSNQYGQLGNGEGWHLEPVALTFESQM